MITHPFLSYEQLYRLFGYKKEVNLEEVFDVLLYSISELSSAHIIIYPSRHICFDYPAETTAVYIYRELKATKNSLPKYLEQSHPFRAMLRIDARLRTLEIKMKELADIKWYQFKRWKNKRKEVFFISEQKVRIEDVFGYLEYRARQEKISPSNLYKKFKEFAENYPDNRF